MSTHPLEGHRDGDTFDPELDLKPLNKQQLRVYYVMEWDQKGLHWHSVEDIARATGDSAASVSARIRDFRKAKFGGHEVLRVRLGRTWYYQLKWNHNYPRPSLDECLAAFKG